jgi:hypothetical protein
MTASIVIPFGRRASMMDCILKSGLDFANATVRRRRENNLHQSLAPVDAATLVG